MQTLLTPIRTPEKKVKTTTVGKLPKIDLRSLLRRIPFGPREAKLAVVLIFTLCWLSIALVRSNVARDPGARDASSLLGLATALQQGAISGRDFQSVYGPAAQFLAWIATLATTTRTALDAYGMITFVFCAATALLAAAMLLICDRISWQQCAIFYAFSFFLNLFFGVLDIRTLLLLLNAAFAYRTIAAETVLRQTAWATACGLLCLVSQLVTFELGICAAITVAFTPMIVVLSLLSTIEWTSVKRRIAWLAGCAAILVWPSLNLSAPLDLWKLMRGEPSAKASIRAIYATPKPLDASLKANLGTPDLADRRDVSILAFPYDNYISVGLRRPFFAPVLESYAASTEALEQYYVRALDRQRRAGLEIVYGLDKDLVPTVDGIQAITRSPIVFEYVYKHFEIVSNEQHTDAHYILRPRRQPRDTAMEELRFSIPRQVVDSGILKLNVPSACGLVQLETRIEYAKNPRIFRPSGIELSLSNSDRAVWQGAVRPLKPSETFVTYISPLPPQTFHKVFGEGPVQNMKWDKLEYHAFRADFLGSPATRIDVTAIRCVDPEKFVEATVPLGAGS